MTAHLLILAPLFGGRSRISDVLSVKRKISKAQAIALSAFFKVPADLLSKADSLLSNLFLSD
jgi:antitoxin component HigA of HigAB toxin-antitoxin module